ncbi:hypothetical protein HanHA300_Chr04g0119831 [Helianthus annuus]|nr:hypothetical protein HanHA300_Chr04g0119831 [Helianthus annuus]KAJ0595505.1 hypothetical protein HanHA89_Chr04g0132091 [Helianthus annuus]
MFMVWFGWFLGQTVSQTVTNGFLLSKTETEPLKIKTESNLTVNGLVLVWDSIID